MAKAARFAIVTPYYKEPRALVERCVASVKGQTVNADHFLVADGFPQSWIDEAQIRHIKLDQPHRDYGNVARGNGRVPRRGGRRRAVARRLRSVPDRCATASSRRAAS